MNHIEHRSPENRAVSLKNFVLLVVIVGVCGVIFVLRQVILLAFAAIVIAIVLSEATQFVKKTTGLSRSKSLAAAFALTVIVAVSISWVFGAQISNQVSELATRLPAALGRVQEQMNGYPMGRLFVAGLTKEFASAGSSVPGLMARAGGLAFGFFDVMIQGLVVITAGIFLASDPKPYRGSVLRLTPKPQRRVIKSIFDQSGRSISRWMGGTLISMMITASLVLACLLAFGVPAPIALALLAGLSQIVPVIGPVASAGVGILLAATVSFEVAGGVAIAYFVISQLEANVITPTILRQAVKVPPAMVLFSILAMGTLFGSLGVVLAIPAFLVLCDVIEVMRKPAIAS